MKNKLIKTLLSISLLVSCFGSLTVNADNNYVIKDEAEAKDTAVKYIERAVDSGEKQWEGHVIINSSKLYDSNYNEIGFDFGTRNERNSGYLFAIKVQDQYEIIESSYDVRSPFALDRNKYRIYAGPTFYYSSNNIDSKELYSIVEKRNVIKSEMHLFKNIFDENSQKNLPDPIYFTKYLNTYNNNFVSIPQDSSYKCVPTSFAMGLRYLHNKGSLSISINNNSTMRDKLFTLMNGTTSGTFTPGIRLGLDSFTNTYSTRRVTTNDGVWGSSRSFSTIKQEIDDDYPAVIVFGAGTFSFNPGVNHACTLVGYKYDGTLNTSNHKYVIVSDPWDQGTKTVAWSYVLGYFILYVH